MSCSRREFLKLMGASTAGTVLFAGCVGLPPGLPPAREMLIQSPARIPEDLATGLDNFYATVCQQCTASCGILVRVVEGRAKKIEGNPDHPLNFGKHSARGEASLQGLYHPDRLLSPLRRKGDRGQGQFEQVSWDEAMDELVDRLRRIQQAGQGGNLVVITEPLRGHMALVVNRFLGAYGGQQLTFEPLGETTTRTVLQRIFGQEQLPDFEIDNARYIISFGADFLGTWLSPVRYGRQYGEFRQGRPSRGILVQVEPRFSMTAASADLWVPIRPGTEGLLALSMAQVMVAEGLADPAAARAMIGGNAGALDAYQPERVAEATQVSADRTRQLARDFGTKRPSLALGGGPASAQTNGSFNLQAIYALNFLAGSVGSNGVVRLNPPSPLLDVPSSTASSPFRDWQQLADRLRTNLPRAVDAVLIHNANPVYGLPQVLGFGDALARAPFIVSFSSFMDETTALADLVMPDHHFLEAWGDAVPDPGPGYQVLGFQQPVVRPMGDTRGFADLLLAVAEELGGEVHRALPWNSLRDALRDAAGQLQGLRRGSVQNANFEEFWVQLLQRGGWWGAWPEPHATVPAAPALPLQPQLPTFSGSEEEYPFHLVVFPSSSLLGGQLAHLPWLQALPDPTSTVVWQSWLEINPEEAGKLGVQTGDILAVESTEGSLEVPAYLHPATPPGILGMPAGQGHSDFTRYATRRGVNPLDVVAPLTDSETGGLAWAATRVRLRKTGRRIDLPKFEGTVPARQLPDAEVVPTTSQ